MKVFPFIIIIIVFLLSNFYVFYRLWHLMPATTVGRIILVIGGVLAVSFFFLNFLLGDSMPFALTSFMYKIGTSWIFVFLYLLLVFLILEIVRVTHLFPLEKWMYGNWIGFVSIVGLVACVMIAGYINYNNKKKVTLTLHTTKVINKSEPLRIIAISDLHLGYNIGKKEFRKWVELINKEKPDIVLIPGDMIDNSVKPLYEQKVAEIFKEINSTYGVYVSPGNHEYIANISKSMDFFKTTNLHFLKDSVVLVDDLFYVVGRDDRSNPRRKTMKQLTADLDATKPIILLDHQPYHLEEAEENGIDLQLSGHTHRGQIWPISWITDKIYEDSHGYVKKGDTHIYVSSGIGIWGGKFRIGTQSEYVVIDLVTN